MQERSQKHKTVSQGRTHSSMLLRDNDMIRKWEDVTTTDTFTMYYASVFRGRLVVPRQRVHVKYV
jgi:hypothetical protein